MNEHPAAPIDPGDDTADARRRLLLTLLPALGLGLGSESRAQDAVARQPANYKVALENDRVRVLDFTARPGLGVCGVGMHSHPAHLTVALSPGKVRIKLPDGKVIEAENQLGDVFWSEAETHEVENITGRNMRGLLIELKPAHAGKA